MCRPFSGIIGHKHSKVFYDLDIDSHEELIKKFKLRDDKDTPNFVRFEINPKNNVFDKSPENWVFRIDQDRIPDWFDKKRAEKQARVMLADFLENRVLVGKKIDEITEGRWFFRDCTIREISWGAKVTEIAGKSKVTRITEDAKVDTIAGKSKVTRIEGNVKITEITGDVENGAIAESVKIENDLRKKV